MVTILLVVVENRDGHIVSQWALRSEDYPYVELGSLVSVESLGERVASFVLFDPVKDIQTVDLGAMYVDESPVNQLPSTLPPNGWGRTFGPSRLRQDG